MLILSFLALCTACLVMYLHLNGDYDNYPWWNTSEAGTSTSTSLNVAPPHTPFAETIAFDRSPVNQFPIARL
ncbi:MAG: hypothetical protein QGF59_05820 [Pirellulaceae bacterium]|nr:hypothetical protein [Pirellulaceae bacterium]